MTDLATLAASFLCLFMAQIIRVRFFNILIEPHFSIGMRSGMYLNAFSSFFNILTPFRLGELYKYYFLRKRYNAKSSFIITAIVAERIIDTIFLLVILLLSFSLNGFREIVWQITFLTLAAFIVMMIPNLQKSSVLSVTSKEASIKIAFAEVFAQLRFLIRLKFKVLLLLAISMWMFYTSAGLFLVKYSNEPFDSWVSWNLDVFRVYDLTSKTFQLDSLFNLVFIFAFLGVALIVSFLSHNSGRLFQFLSNSTSDKFLGNSARIFQDTNIRRKLLLAPVESYIRSESITKTNSIIYPGGSGALIYSSNLNSGIIHKVAFGHSSARLEDQYNYIRELPVYWNFPRVSNPVKRVNFFSYDIERVASGVPLNTFMGTFSDLDHRNNLSKMLFDFIEIGNSSKKSISDSETRQNLDEVWQLKISRIIRDLKVQLPYFFSTDKVMINDIPYDNLDILMHKIRRKAFESYIPSEVTSVHGDAALSNLLWSLDQKNIFAIDPNPNQIFKNAVIDHGKVLQSLWADYENLLTNAKLQEVHISRISYSVSENSNLSGYLSQYGQLLTSLGIFEISKIMCFVSMVRLLPYRINLDNDNSAIFLARTVEVGTKILVEDENGF